MDELVSMMRESVLADLALWIAIVVASSVFFAEIVCFHKYGIKSKRKRDIETAERLGHVIKAPRTSIRYSEDSIETKLSDRVYSAVYTYEVNGRKKRKIIVRRGDEPPENLILYYKNNPSKTFTANDPTSCFLIALFYLLPVAALAAVYHLLTLH